MADTLVLDIDYNISKAEAKTKMLEAQWEKQKQKVDEINRAFGETKTAIEEANKSLEKQKDFEADLKAQIKERKAELKEIAESQGTREYTYTAKGGIVEKTQTDYGRAKQDIAEMSAELEKQPAIAEALNNRIRTLSGEYAKQNIELNLQKGKLGEIQANITGVQSGMGGVTKRTKSANVGMNGLNKSLTSINKRIFGLMKRVFFFSVITKLFRKLKESFSGLISQDKEMSKDLAQIKANFAVIGQTLFQTVAPALRTILSFVNKLTQAIAVLLSSALGKDINQMKKLAKESKKVAKNTEDAAKSTASFDTINIAGGGKDSKSGESGGADFSGIDQAQATLDELALIAMASGAVMMGLGILLIAFGQLPQGIGLLATGALLLYGGAKLAEGQMSEKTKKMLTTITTAAGLALIALGIILLCFGIIPVGIALLVAGAVSLVSAVALQEGTLKEKIQTVLKEIAKIAGGAMIAIGLIFIITGLMIPAGIAMIAAGLGLMEKGGVKKEAIINWVKSVTKQIGSLFSKMWAGIKEGFKNAWDGVVSAMSKGGKIFLNIGKGIFDTFKSLVNVIFDGINTVVAIPFKGLNAALKKLKNIKILKAKPFGWMPTIPVPHLPHLAQGGVIPGGREFMAVLGDQPAGQTNIEAPLETIKQALAEVMGGYNPQFNIKATGSMSQLIAMLGLKIEQEKKRASIWG